jgi:hypothetical protein
MKTNSTLTNLLRGVATRFLNAFALATVVAFPSKVNGVAEVLPPTVLTGPIVNPATGHQYYLLDKSDWVGAEAVAVAMGGHLATIRSQTEQDFIFNTFANYGGVPRHLWIGLFDADPANNSSDPAVRQGEFAWASGEPVNYTHWNQGEPNAFQGTEPYVMMFSPAATEGGGLWNDTIDRNWDFFNYSASSGVVEIIPPHNPPVAHNQVIALHENTSTFITVTGVDPSSPSLPLTYTVTVNPLNGTLSGVPPTVTYKPNPNFTGIDHFGFLVSDGVSTSAVATVTISVLPTPLDLIAEASVASGQTATVSISPSDNQAGITATLTKNSDGAAATMSVQTYPGNPTPNPIGGPGTSFVDLRILGTTAADRVDARFANPNAITPSIGGGVVVYHQPPLNPEDGNGIEGGGAWHRAIGSPRRGFPSTPIIIPSGGSTTTTFDGSSTPALGLSPFITANFSGTVFAIATVAPPTARDNNWGTVANKSVSVPAVKLLAGALSSTAGPLSITAVSPMSVAKGAVSLHAGVITYTPPADFIGEDSFTYTLSDDFASGSGAVIVSVQAADQQSHNEVSLKMSGSCAIVQFLGIPAVSYVLQWADSPGGPWTDFLPAVPADSFGMISYTDCNHQSARFYRTRLDQ